MNKSIPIGKVKEEIKIDEEHWVERAEQFFEASLKETNEKNAAVAFGKGLANFITIYENRSWWEQKSFLKSYKTGIRPVADAIKAFSNKVTSEAFDNVLDVLYASVFKNHSVKAFKSKLETANLRKILTGTNKIKDGFQKNSDKNVQELIQKIAEIKNEKDWESDEAEKAYNIAEFNGTWFWVGILLGGFPGLFMLGLAAFMALYGSIHQLLGAAIEKAAGTNYGEAVRETLKKFRCNLSKKFSKYASDIQSGIKRQYIMNKVEMGKDNEKDLKELEKETKEQLKKNKKTK